MAISVGEGGMSKGRVAVPYSAPCGKIFAFTESRECCLPRSSRYILHLTSVRTRVLVPVRKRVSAWPDCVCILRGHNQVESRVFICLYALILVPLTLF